MATPPHRHRRRRSSPLLALALGLGRCRHAGPGLALLLLATQAEAQISTATVRGQVVLQGEIRAPAPGATVVATNAASGYVTRTSANAEGQYVLTALQPGTYRIVANAPGNNPVLQVITLRVGQTVALDLALGLPDVTSNLQTVIVTGSRDNRSSEVGSNVSPRQIEALPQLNRNFLAFADTVPGVTMTVDDDGSTRLRGGALPTQGVNVYIDGVGQKDYVLKGGITGQDSSRGNPFPQSAIAEYKVITQNYKAEYDQISSTAVAAVTKSGGNQFSGELFWDHTQGGWRASTPDEQREGGKESTRENQFGLAMGGPIVVNRAHWFLAYEGKRIDSPRSVSLGEGRGLADIPPAYRDLVGSAVSPFREDLLFAKLDWAVDDANLLEFSLKLRDESEIAGIREQDSADWASRKRTEETRLDLRWQRSADTWVNEARLTYEDADYAPRARLGEPGVVLTTDEPGQVVLNAGGGREYQQKGQKGWGLQNDLTLTGFQWKGNHIVKVGAKLKSVEVSAREQSPYNAQYYYDIDRSTTVPYQVSFGAPLEGVGDGRARSRNTQVGLYVQDDWEINNNFTVNAGLRWDYEHSPAYLNYRTPPDVVAALRRYEGINAAGSGVDIDDYISTGSNRKSFKGAWQPRLGLAFDLNADQRHVIFGGYARAYDRTIFDYLQLERTKSTFPSYTYFFDTPGHGCAGEAGRCLDWDPRYLDPAVLAGLATASNAGREIDLLHNDLKTPYSDQFSIGMRNRVRDWNTEVALSHVRGKDGFAWLLGNRRPDGSFFAPGDAWGPPYNFQVPGYGSLLLGTNALETRSNAVLLKADKPYTIESGWGATLAYTYTRAKENRQFGEHYALDYPSIDGYGWRPAGGVSRHRIVATGTWQAPHDILVAARLTLATPAPRYGLDCRESTATSNQCRITQLEPRGRRFLVGGPVWGYRQVDLAVSKAFKVPGGTLRLRGDLINVFNHKNYDGYDTTRGTAGDPNPAYGDPQGSLAGPTRTFKLGLAYAW